MTKSLYKTTIVIWTDYDPDTEGLNLSDLVFQADEGDAYCSLSRSIMIKNPAEDPDWDNTEFFDEFNEGAD